jgi:hypothetical protein
MAVERIGLRPLMVLYNILADPAAGFNAMIGTLMPEYPNVTDAPTVNFGTAFGEQTENFVLGPTDFLALEQTTPIKPGPCVLGIYMGTWNNRTSEPVRQKFTVFSGYVNVVCEAHLSWPDVRLPKDPESLPAMIGEALVTLMNQVGAQSQYLPTTYWNGDIVIDPGPLNQNQAQHWYRKLKASMTFRVTCSR